VLATVGNTKARIILENTKLIKGAARLALPKRFAAVLPAVPVGFPDALLRLAAADTERVNESLIRYPVTTSIATFE
jgi:hypothetical protein